MKVFISQPMRGLTDEQIQRARDRAVRAVRNTYGEDVEVLDTFFKDAPAEARPLWYLGKSLEYLADADLAVFVRGWDSARGCRIEHQSAEAYGISVMYID